jgi:hypothetical protein
MHSLSREEAHKLAGGLDGRDQLAGGLEKSTKPSGCRELADGALGDEGHREQGDWPFDGLFAWATPITPKASVDTATAHPIMTRFMMISFRFGRAREVSVTQNHRTIPDWSTTAR